MFYLCLQIRFWVYQKPEWSTEKKGDSPLLWHSSETAWSAVLWEFSPPCWGCPPNLLHVSWGHNSISLGLRPPLQLGPFAFNLFFYGISHNPRKFPDTIKSETLEKSPSGYWTLFLLYSPSVYSSKCSSPGSCPHSETMDAQVTFSKDTNFRNTDYIPFPYMLL